MNASLFLCGFGLLAVSLGVASSINCMDAYDTQGRPIQVVDAGVAIAGAAAAGTIGYSLSNDHNGHHHYRRGYDSHRGYNGRYRGTYRRY